MASTEQIRKRQQRVQARQSAAPVRLPVIPLLLGSLAFVGMMISLWMVFFYAQTDATEGVAQRIFYMHVPMAWVGMLSFGVLTLAGICYMIKKDERWDWLARAAAEVGTVFLTLALVLGSIWGKTTWGTWWTWEPKLTATLILWFMFVAYLMLRSYMGRTRTSAYAGAVLAIVGIVDVPIIYLSTTWLRSLHPTAVTGSLPPTMALTFLVAMVSMTLLYCFLLTQLYQLEKLQAQAQRLLARFQ